MNPYPPEACAWSPRRWLCLCGTLLALHVGAIWYFSAPAPASKKDAGFGPRMLWAADPAAAHAINSLPLLEQSVLFALPGNEGFSGSAWLAYRPQQGNWNDWVDAPEWLRISADRLGDGYRATAVTNTFAPLLIADKPMPRLLGFETLRVNDPPPARSALQILGTLAQRVVVNEVDLPAWPYTDLLTNTVVQVLVDGAGEVVTACILDSCGLKAADDHAMQQARAARFAVAPPAERLTSGRLVFQWHTLAMPLALNASSAAPAKGVP